MYAVVTGNGPSSWWNTPGIGRAQQQLVGCAIGALPTSSCRNTCAPFIGCNSMINEAQSLRAGAVRRVIVLLALRHEWRQRGRQLQLEPEARDTRPRRLRQRKWARIGRMLEQRKALFDHVVRRRGVLQYKH